MRAQRPRCSQVPLQLISLTPAGARCAHRSSALHTQALTHTHTHAHTPMCASLFFPRPSLDPSAIDQASDALNACVCVRIEQSSKSAGKAARRWSVIASWSARTERACERGRAHMHVSYDQSLQVATAAWLRGEVQGLREASGA